MVGSMKPRRWLTALCVLLSGFSICSLAHAADAVRLKDIARVQGYRQHMVVGYGIVTGLAGTGDSPGNRATRQSVANALAQFNLTLPPDAIASRNVAAVMISAALPAFAKPGDAIDVSVTSVGDARSLVGGNLMMAPLKGPDGKVYALAQGALTVGGYQYDANGNLSQKNHPTAATVPAGATVEVAPPNSEAAVQEARKFSISLLEADYTTAARISDAINREFGMSLSKPIDAQAVEVMVLPNYSGKLVDMIRRIEALSVTPDIKARVVINERTGTVVAGAAVRIAPVAISYGDLKISVVTDNAVSQPSQVTAIGGSIASVPYSNSRVDVRESSGAALTTQAGGTVSDLVQALGRLKTNTRDVVSILKSLKAAGALHAELVVQ